jgi:hypothetical protein
MLSTAVLYTLSIKPATLYEKPMHAKNGSTGELMFEMSFSSLPFGSLPIAVRRIYAQQTARVNALCDCCPRYRY